MSLDEQIQRILRVTDMRNFEELSAFLEVRQAAVNDARRRGKLPLCWLVTLLQWKRVNPEWVLTGCGPCFISLEPEDYETEDEAKERASREELLRRLPARVLLEELLRRITLTGN